MRNQTVFDFDLGKIGQIIKIDRSVIYPSMSFILL